MWCWTRWPMPSTSWLRFVGHGVLFRGGVPWEPLSTPWVITSMHRLDWETGWWASLLALIYIREKTCQRTIIYTRGLSVLPRCVLIILLILAKNAIFALEQPSLSLLPRHKRMEWLMNRVCYASSLVLFCLIALWCCIETKISPCLYCFDP